MKTPEEIFKLAVQLRSAATVKDLYAAINNTSQLTTADRVLHLIIYSTLLGGLCNKQTIRDVFGLSKKQQMGYTGSLIGLGLIEETSKRDESFPILRSGFVYIGPIANT